jgi:hypothetical protein
VDRALTAEEEAATMADLMEHCGQVRMGGGAWQGRSVWLQRHASKQHRWHLCCVPLSDTDRVWRYNVAVVDSYLTPAT